MSTPKIELIKLSFTKFEFSINLDAEKEIDLEVTKKADCLFSKDLSLKRALVILEFSVKSTEDGAFIFNSIAQVELQLDEIPKENVEKFQEDILIPYADKLVSEKIKELTEGLGHGPLDLTK